MSKKGRNKNKTGAQVAVASPTRSSKRPSPAPNDAKSAPPAGPRSSPPSGQPIASNTSTSESTRLTEYASVGSGAAPDSAPDSAKSLRASSRAAVIAVESGTLAAPNVPAEWAPHKGRITTQTQTAHIHAAYDSGRDAHDEDAEAFFASAPLLPIDVSEANDHDDLHAPRSLRHLQADVIERRAQHTKYVRIALIALGGLALAGIVRWASNRHETSAPSAKVIASSTAETSTSAFANAPSSAAPQSTTLGIKDPLNATAPDAAPDAAQVEGENEFSALSAAERAKGSKDARVRAERALDAGKLKEAIEAAELATHTDPQDGDAWLLLGAAYQQQGNPNEARRCFLACTKQAKRGAITECRQMLR